MAKFRESSADAAPRLHDMPQHNDTEAADVRDRSIGDIIRDIRNLSADQVQKVLAYQQEKGLRFGEAAVALGYASTDDVLYALSQQFHYPYAAEEQRKHNQELISLNQPFSVQSEAFRAIRSQLMLRIYAEGEPRRALAIVSPDSGDGKTFFCANLGVALAQLGGRTLVIDGDMRGPRLHEVFGVSNTAGLSGILSGRSEAKVIQQVEGVPSLFVLPVGIAPPNPLELVERPAFGLLVRELVTKFDHVIIDTPAAIYGSDHAAIAAKSGAALVIARKNASRINVLQDLVGSLSETPAKIAGVIVNEF